MILRILCARGPTFPPHPSVAIVYLVAKFFLPRKKLSAVLPLIKYTSHSAECSPTSESEHSTLAWSFEKWRLLPSSFIIHHSSFIIHHSCPDFVSLLGDLISFCYSSVPPVEGYGHGRGIFKLAPHRNPVVVRSRLILLSIAQRVWLCTISLCAMI